MMSQLCEDIRNAVDEMGAKRCYQKSVMAYHKKTGLPLDGLWSAVDAVLQGYNPEKTLKRLHKSWGGSPEEWAKWFALAQQRPDC